MLRILRNNINGTISFWSKQITDIKTVGLYEIMRKGLLIPLVFYRIMNRIKFRIYKTFKLFTTNAILVIKNFQYLPMFFYTLNNKIDIFLVKREHIGHYPINLYLSKMKYGTKNIYIYDNDKKCNVNNYFDSKIEKLFNFDQKFENVYKIMQAVSILSFGKYYYNEFPEQMGLNTQFSKLFPVKNKLFDFNDKENQFGNEFLKKYNIEPGNFVCLHIRSNEYYLDRGLNKIDDRIFYNQNPNIYINSLKYLLESNYSVIRMGKGVKNMFPFSHPNFVDYAFSDDRNDFLDIWLSANCKFIFGSTSGFTQFPMIFGVPYLDTNNFPYGRMQSWGPQYVTLPSIARRHGKSLLTLKDIVELDLIGRADQRFFDKLSVEIIESSPQDILNAVKDIENKIQKGFIVNDINMKFWTNMKNEWHSGMNLPWSEPDKYFDYFHKMDGISVTIPDFYLEKYSHLFLDY